jgi:hypothetical protein
VPQEPNSSDTLTTLTLTTRERIVLARALTMATAMVDALGDDTRALMDLWARVQPDGEVF